MEDDPHSDDDEPLSKRPAKRPRNGATTARRGSTGEQTRLLSPLNITQAFPSDQANDSSIPLRCRRYHRERPPTDLGATEPYLLWQRTLGELEPLPSWSWNVTYAHDAPWIPSRAPSAPRPPPIDDAEPPEETATSPKLRRRRMKFVPDPNLIPRRSSRTLTRATSMLGGPVSPSAVARVLPSVARSSARISSQSSSSTLFNIIEQEADTRMEPVAEGSEAVKNGEDELDVAVAVAELAAASSPLTSESEQESIALSLISLSNFRQGEPADHAPVEHVVESAADPPSPSCPTPPLIISRRPFTLPQKPFISETCQTLARPSITSPPRPNSADSRFRSQSTTLHMPETSEEKPSTCQRSEALLFKPRRKRPSGAISQSRAHRPWTTADDNERGNSLPHSFWAPIQIDMVAQRRTIKSLQDMLFRGGEDAIDSIYSSDSLVANLSFLNSRGKVPPLTPNYAYATLLRRKPRRDRLVQPFLHVKHTLTCSPERVESALGQASEYVYGRCLSAEELAWLKERRDGLFTFLETLASVRRVNEITKEIKEREGIVDAQAKEMEEPVPAATGSRKRRRRKGGRR